MRREARWRSAIRKRAPTASARNQFDRAVLALLLTSAALLLDGVLQRIALWVWMGTSVGILTLGYAILVRAWRPHLTRHDRPLWESDRRDTGPTNMSRPEDIPPPSDQEAEA